MANSYITHFAKFNPLSYDELMKPVVSATTQHDKVADTYAELEAAATSIGENLDPQRDAPEYAAYQNYINQIQKAADDLQNRGIIGNPSAFDSARKAKATYGTQIVPIQQQIAARQEYIKSEVEKQAKDPSYISTFDPNNISVSAFAKGNRPTDYGVSGEDLYKMGVNASKAASEREAILGKWGVNTDMLRQYLSRVDITGWSNADIEDSIDGLSDIQGLAAVLKQNGDGSNMEAYQDSKRLLRILADEYNRISTATGMDKFFEGMDESNAGVRSQLYDQAANYLYNGLIDGISYKISSKEVNNNDLDRQLKRLQINEKLSALNPLPEVPDVVDRTSKVFSGDNSKIAAANNTINKYFNPYSGSYDGDSTFFENSYEDKGVGKAYSRQEVALTFENTIKEAINILNGKNGYGMGKSSIPVSLRGKFLKDAEAKLKDVGVDINDYLGTSVDDIMDKVQVDLELSATKEVDKLQHIVVTGNEGDKPREAITSDLKGSIKRLFGVHKKDGTLREGLKDTGDYIREVSENGDVNSLHGLTVSKIDEMLDNADEIGYVTPKIDLRGVIQAGSNSLNVNQNELKTKLNAYMKDIVDKTSYLTVNTTDGRTLQFRTDLQDDQAVNELDLYADELLKYASRLPEYANQMLMQQYIKLYKENPNWSQYRIQRVAEENVAYDLTHGFLITNDDGKQEINPNYRAFMDAAVAENISNAYGYNFNQVQGATSSN